MAGWLADGGTLNRALSTQAASKLLNTACHTPLRLLFGPSVKCATTAMIGAIASAVPPSATQTDQWNASVKVQVPPA